MGLRRIVQPPPTSTLEPKDIHGCFTEVSRDLANQVRACQIRDGLQLRRQRAELFGVQLMCDDRVCEQPCSPFRARSLQNGRVFEVFLLPMAGTIRVVLTAIEVPQQLRTGQYRLGRLLEDRFHWTHTRRVAALQELACEREADR